MGAASKKLNTFNRPMVESVLNFNRDLVGMDTTGKSAFASNLAETSKKYENQQASLKAPDLTDQIIKSVAAAELRRKKMGATRESMFVSERPSPSQMDAARAKQPALNQYTPKPKPPGGA